ncbi:sugar phosphate isomerase/epimerase [Cohnella pontilimi]|uniref:Sugar phosphate isomerase/epimerase n=1 Tax=Cohnella pontilimi TaxID=2564100 RepID=A0A4U0FDL8_9BACL|nr:TIM barrel protein [Cohnella pontilimi]TJY42877.1 sugar phosphate isomerase/epimerase [Cohnella pontilimi]
MKLSIGGFSFFNTLLEGKMDIFGYLETVKYRYRLDAVDLWNGLYGTADDQDGLLRIWDEDRIRKIRDALDERQLNVANIAIDGAHLIDKDPVRREKLYHNALANLRASEILGAKTVRIDFCSSDTEEIGEQDFDYIVHRYREFCERAAQHGYKIGPENHMGAALNPHLHRRIAEAVDHPNYGILLHLKRWKPEYPDGDAVVAPWVVHTHVDAKTAVSEEVHSSIEALRKSGFDGYWAVEYNAAVNQYTEIEWLLATVKKLLGSTAKA